MEINIWLEKSDDFDKIQSINCTLTVYDNGTPQMSSSTTLEIQVANENNFSPYFYKNLAFLQIRSDIPKNHSIYTAVATDKDGNGKVEEMW